jgi:hypothetical protein
MSSQEDINEQQSEFIFKLETENNDLKQNMHAKIDTIYAEMLEMKAMIQFLIPPSGMRMEADDSVSVSSIGSCQSESEYTPNNQQVTVIGKGVYPVFVKCSDGKLFSHREDGSFKRLSALQESNMHVIPGHGGHVGMW